MSQGPQPPMTQTGSRRDGPRSIPHPSLHYSTKAQTKLQPTLSQNKTQVNIEISHANQRWLDKRTAFFSQL